MGNQQSGETIVETRKARWEKKAAADGREFWVDHKTKKTHWNLPPDARLEEVLVLRQRHKGPPRTVAKPAAKAAPAKASAGGGASGKKKTERAPHEHRWEEKKAKDGRMYWVDHRSRKTYWTLPDGVDTSERMDGQSSVAVAAAAAVADSRDTGETGVAGGVLVNGGQLSDSDKGLLEQELGQPVESGEYWYDCFCGSWGIMGGPAIGRISSGLQLGSSNMKRECSGGDTGILLNGRELHELDYSALAAIGVVLSAGEWWADADGNIGQTGDPSPRYNLDATMQQLEAGHADPAAAPPPFYPPPLHGTGAHLMSDPALLYPSYPHGGGGGYPTAGAGYPTAHGGGYPTGPHGVPPPSYPIGGGYPSAGYPQAGYPSGGYPPPGEYPPPGGAYPPSYPMSPHDSPAPAGAGSPQQPDSAPSPNHHAAQYSTPPPYDPSFNGVEQAPGADRPPPPGYGSASDGNAGFSNYVDPSTLDRT